MGEWSYFVLCLGLIFCSLLYNHVPLPPFQKKKGVCGETEREKETERESERERERKREIRAQEKARKIERY
jgi:hypothetical protein